MISFTIYLLISKYYYIILAKPIWTFFSALRQYDEYRIWIWAGIGCRSWAKTSYSCGRQPVTHPHTHSLIRSFTHSFIHSFTHSRAIICQSLAAVTIDMRVRELNGEPPRRRGNWIDVRGVRQWLHWGVGRIRANLWAKSVETLAVGGRGIGPRW